VPPPSRTGDFAAAVRDALAGMDAAGVRPAALLIDTVFASDGIVADVPGGLADAVDAVRAAGGVFIADEVQAGFGRTGDHLWGYARHGVTPDLVTMGKPMGNGHPVAGVAVRHDVLAPFAASVRYFNTFGGNPVSCAAAAAVLDVLEEERILERVQDVGRYLAERLCEVAADHEALGEVRSAGLMIGVQVDGADTAAAIVDGLRDRGVLVGSTGADGDVLKIRPPLVFGRDHADLLVEQLEAVLSAAR
jgi:4-aminobutyrate aminotransferase-like enzyme